MISQTRGRREGNENSKAVIVSLSPGKNRMCHPGEVRNIFGLKN